MHGRKPIAMLIALSLAVTAGAATCPTSYSAGSDGGKAWLGMNAGGFIAGEGQSFAMDCAGAFYGVDFRLILDGNSWYGVPPLASGDLLYCKLMTPTGVVLGTKSLVIGYSLGTRTIHFDFSDLGIQLTPGNYILACYNTSPKQARLSYNQNGSLYADGQRYLSENGGIGPWVAIPAEQGDLAFQVFVEGGGVPNETADWSAVKSYYR